MNARWLPVLALSTFVAALTATTSLAADTDNFLGRWTLTLKEPAGELTGLLEIRKDGANIIGRVEGGPIKLKIEQATIEMTIDSRDAGGRSFDRKYTGTLKTGAMEGTYVSNDVGRTNPTPRAWTATRAVAEQSTSQLKPQPVDLSGLWNTTSRADLRKYSMDLTPPAQEWVKGYNPEIDQPALRCVSPGLVALFGWVYPFEIVQTPSEVIIFYEGYGQVRRIYIDGRARPKDQTESRLGYSLGHWEGSTLVVETTSLQANIRDFRGEPLSENTRVVERYTLSNDGQSLSGVLTVHDPENYREPPIRRVVRRRDKTTSILPYECDPDSFFRQLYDDKKMDEYMKRRDHRL